MNKELFGNIEYVVKFTDWLSEELLNVRAHIKLKSSKFVKGGIDANCCGVDEVLSHYQWNSFCKNPVDDSAMFSSDWVSTKELLNKLSDEIIFAMDDYDNDKIAKVCHSILQWGGNRNKKVGATPVIDDLRQTGELYTYIKNCREIFEGNKLDKDKLKLVKHTGSMWTKIYALSSRSVAPIYDSRVAAAASSFVAKFAHNVDMKAWQCTELRFPVPSQQRGRTSITLDGEEFKFPHLKNNEIEWTDATMRLSWIMDKVLPQVPLFPNEKKCDKKHAFEAVFFMLGYNTASLSQ